MATSTDLTQRAANLAHLYDAAVHGDPPGIFPDSTYERPNWAEVVQALGEALEIITALAGGARPAGAEASEATVCEQVYYLLVAEAGALDDEANRLQFQRWWERTEAGTTGSEFRFCGSLGFGGKFWKRHDRWSINCYGEDETPVRRATIERVNALLAQLRERSRS